MELSKQQALAEALRDDIEQYELLRDAIADENAINALDEEKLLEIESQYSRSSYASILLAIKFCSPDPAASRKSLKHANTAVERLAEFMKLSEHYHHDTFLSALSIRACASHLSQDYETELQTYLIANKYFRSKWPPLLYRNIANLIDLSKAGVTSKINKSAISILEKDPFPKIIPGVRENNYVLRQIDTPNEFKTAYDVILLEKSIAVPISRVELQAVKEGHAKIKMEEIKKAKKNSFPPQLQGLWCVVDAKELATGEEWRPDPYGEPIPFAKVIGNQVWLINEGYTATVVDWKVSSFQGTPHYTILLSDGVTWTVFCYLLQRSTFSLNRSDSRITAAIRNMPH